MFNKASALKQTTGPAPLSKQTAVQLPDQLSQPLSITLRLTRNVQFRRRNESASQVCVQQQLRHLLVAKLMPYGSQTKWASAAALLGSSSFSTDGAVRELLTGSTKACQALAVQPCPLFPESAYVASDQLHASLLQPSFAFARHHASLGRSHHLQSVLVGPNNHTPKDHLVNGWPMANNAREQLTNGLRKNLLIGNSAKTFRVSKSCFSRPRLAFALFAVSVLDSGDKVAQSAGKRLPQLTRAGLN